MNKTRTLGSLRVLGILGSLYAPPNFLRLSNDREQLSKTTSWIFAHDHRIHSREFHVGFPLSFFSHGVVGDVVDVYDTRPPPVQRKAVSSVTCSQAHFTYSLPPS